MTDLEADIVIFKARIKQLEAERDAAVRDLTKLATKPVTPCHSCSKTCLFTASLALELQPPTWCREWKWRGMKGEANGTER